MNNNYKSSTSTRHKVYLPTNELCQSVQLQILYVLFKKKKTIAKDTYLQIPKLAKLSLEWHSVILVALTVSVECDIFLSAIFYSIHFEGHSNIQEIQVS